MYASQRPTDDLPGHISLLEEAVREAEDAGNEAMAEMLRDDLRDHERELARHTGAA